MPMFLAESREHLQELNLAVVHLEEAPDDRDTVDEIFRIAHSLKGMSATMGFAQIAALTHQMEEVFELLRQRSGGLSREAIDTVLACLDALSETVDGIESTGTETLDPGPLSERLRQLVRSGAERRDSSERREGDERRETAEPTPEPVPADQPEELLELAASLSAGTQLIHVRATLDADALMPAARALMLLAGLADHGEVVRSQPTQDDVEAFKGHEIEVWVVSEHELERLTETARAITDVIAVDVTAVDATTAGDAAPLAAEEAETTEPQSAPAAGTQAPAQAQAHAPTKAATTVRVDADRLDTLMHSMGELVIHRTAVEALTAGLDVPGLQQAVQDLTRSSQALQQMVMQVRMIPVDIVFLRFPRLVRDLSTKLGKEVDLELIGKETELDRTVVDALGDPLVHLVRNSLDHALEPPEERLAAGKPRAGKLEISARHAGGSVVIEVRDDGRGVDPAAVGRKAVKSGLIDEETAATLDMRGALELLFAPGFSTAEQASDISGRGVGMDAVRNKIRELGGEVVLESAIGKGTLAQIRLPLTLAIVSALQVDIGGAPFAIPLDRVERTLRLSETTVSSVAGRRVLVLEDAVLPLIEGSEAFNRAPLGEHELVVIIRGQDRRLGVTVDELVGQRELVTRALPSIVSEGEPVSGGAVLADGRIALIVDSDALASNLTGTSPGGAHAQSPVAV
jgi:two-component system chemotaxis sensor kinase CheA